MGPESQTAGADAPSGDAIRAIRKALGWTQQQFADVFGIRRSTVVRWEGDLTKMSPAMRLTLRRLLNRSDIQAHLAAVLTEETALAARAA